MNIKLKKIIAREFLIFLMMLSTGFLFFTCIYLYNSYQENKVEKFLLLIESKENNIENLQSSYSKKTDNQKWLFEKVSTKFDISNSKYSELKTLWAHLYRIAKNDSIEYRWNNKWEKKLIEFHNSIGFETAYEFENFIEKNSLSKNDSIKIKDILTIQEEVRQIEEDKNQTQKNIINGYKLEDLFLLTFIVLITIFFILRYLIYSIKWSLKTLKD